MMCVCVLTVTWFADFPRPETTSIIGVYSSFEAANKVMEKLSEDDFFKVGKITWFDLDVSVMPIIHTKIEMGLNDKA